MEHPKLVAAVTVAISEQTPATLALKSGTEIRSTLG